MPHLARTGMHPALDAAAHARDLLPFLRGLNGRAAERPQHRVAVVGAGISGLSAAWSLAQHAHVTLYEADPRFGGHAHTVDLHLDGITHGVDTGFLVFNERTYPLLIQLFAQLGVPTAASDMSFSVQRPSDNLEWAGSNLNTVFAQRRNLARPAFWSLLKDVLRFNHLCTALAREGSEQALAEPIGEFLDRHGFGRPLREWYLMPMVACIWSCPTTQMLQFPIATLIRFCHNHGLLQVTQRPQWYTVRGGSREYVQRMLPTIQDARRGQPLRGLRQREDGRTEVRTDAGTEVFDAVVLACHSDQALRLLDDASMTEQQLLGAIRYHRNRAVLHTDERMLPTRPRAWSAWNYEHGAGDEQAVCLHYLINRLQPLPWQRPVVVSLNPLREPRQVHGSYDYAHPVFDLGAMHAQQQLDRLQGERGRWFCGAWMRYGFHEDGLWSGLRAAQGVLQHLKTLPAGTPPTPHTASIA